VTPEPEPEPDPAASPEAQLRERLWAAANVVAPTSVVTTLLFYFGYVATRARFGYFGVYLDMVDLSFQETLLYGAEVVYPPLIILAILSLLVVAAHTAVRWLQADPGRDPATGWVGLFVTLAGLLAFTRGIVGMLVPNVTRTEAIATTPVSLGGGALALAYGIWLLRLVGIRWDLRRVEHEDGTGEDGPQPPAAGGELAAWLQSAAVVRTSRYALAWVAVIVVAGAFWAANSFAAEYGRGRALDDAESLPHRPEVVLFTKTPLLDPPDGVLETVDPKADKDSFRYRYAGLRLLVESNARLFLVPAQWTTHGSQTMVIPYDDDVRIELVAT
jgi:hypothetical protein